MPTATANTDSCRGNRFKGERKKIRSAVSGGGGGGPGRSGPGPGPGPGLRPASVSAVNFFFKNYREKKFKPLFILI